MKNSIDQLTSPISILKQKIVALENHKDMNSKQKSTGISSLIMTYLRENGKFIKSDINYYYFEKISGKIYSLSDQEFRYLLSHCSGINMVDSYIQYTFNDISVFVFKYGSKTKIRKFSYYDKNKNILYISNNGNKIIKISETKIEEIFNGDEDVIFLNNNLYSKWDLITQDKLDEKNDLKDLIASMSLEDGHISKKDQEFILYQYILCLFFPDLLINRGVITFVGEKGSGKTFFLEILLLIFTGRENSISNLPTKEDDLKVNISNEYLCFFDNVDDKVAGNKIDILCSVATGASIKMRKLYTNGEQINTKINCFLGITSRTPTFKRDDFTDRMLLFFLKRRTGFSSDSKIKDFFDKNRSQIMTKLCLELQKKIQCLKNLEDYTTKFRLSDFSNLIKNFNKGKEKEIEDILMKLQLNQQELATQTDTLLDLIKELLEEKENITDAQVDAFIEGKQFKASDLHRLFSNYAHVNSHLKYYFISPTSLGKALSNNINSYKNVHGINIEVIKARANQKFYIISRMKKDD